MRNPHTLLLSALVLLAVTVQPALAASRTVTRSVTGPNGRTASRSRTVTREAGSRTVTTTATGPNGTTVSRSRTIRR